MRAWSVLRQLLAAILCAALVAPAYASESTLPRSSFTLSHTYDAATLSETRVWGSSEKILLHFRAVLLLSENQHWGSAKRSWKNVVGSVVTYDYDAFGNLIHSSTTLASPTPNNYLFAGEQFDSDLNLYYNRARYLNTSTGRFWTTDDVDGKDERPLSLHKFLYAEDDPVNSVDPGGNEIDELIGSLGVFDASSQYRCFKSRRFSIMRKLRHTSTFWARCFLESIIMHISWLADLEVRQLFFAAVQVRMAAEQGRLSKMLLVPAHRMIWAAVI